VFSSYSYLKIVVHVMPRSSSSKCPYWAWKLLDSSKQTHSKHHGKELMKEKKNTNTISQKIRF